MTQSVQDPDELARLAQEGEKAVVIGRIEWLEEGGAKKADLTPNLIRMEDKHKIMTSVGKDGYFAWPLDAGTYVMYRLAFFDFWSGSYNFPTKITFRVPEKGENYYLGTLRIDLKSKRDFIGGLSGWATFQVIDSLPTDKGEIDNIFGVGPNKVEKRLMVYEPRLPESLDSPEEYDAAKRIIDSVFPEPNE